MSYEYSPKELELFKALNYSPEDSQTVPVMVYNCLSILAFTNDTKGPATESLRRCMRHLAEGKPRMTPEFDALIHWESCKPGCILRKGHHNAPVDCWVPIPGFPHPAS